MLTVPNADQMTRDEMLYAAAAALDGKVDGDGVLIPVSISRTDQTTSERTIARKRGQTRGQTDWQTSVTRIENYADANKQFARLAFEIPARMMATGIKPVVQRPIKATTPEQMAELERRLTPAFAWVDEHVNEGQRHVLPGMRHVTWSMARRLLSGGICGYRATLGTRLVNGVKWRVITTFETYSGEQMKFQGRDDGGEVWTVKAVAPTGKARPSGPNLSTQDFGYGAGQYPLVDRLEDGILAGVVKLDHPVGEGQEWPVPPYRGLLDTLLALEMFGAGDLEVLSQNERTIGFWHFDVKAVLDAGLQLWDSPLDDGRVIKGEISRFMDLRQSGLVAGAGGRREMGLPAWVKWTEVHPDLDLLKATVKYAGPEQRMREVLGLYFTPDGTALKEFSESVMEGDAVHLREGVLENSIGRVFQAMWQDNVERFGALNGAGTWHPFQWGNPAAGQRSSTDATRRKDGILKLLDGENELIVVRVRLRPSSARTDPRRSHVLQLVNKGIISRATAQEIFNLDPDAESIRKAEEWADTVTLKPGEIPKGAPLPTFTQASMGAQETKLFPGQESPGRTPGSLNEEPPAEAAPPVPAPAD